MQLKETGPRNRPGKDSDKVLQRQPQKPKIRGEGIKTATNGHIRPGENGSITIGEEHETVK
jgi:hypothetical protein